MARTPLFRALQKALRPKRSGPTRRDVFKGVFATAALAPILAACGDNQPTVTNPPIAIIGGGIAGVTCAYMLKLAGVKATVFEASMRIGGRTYTQREGLDGQLVELGGELVDSDHVVMQALAMQLGLTLDDLPAVTAGLEQDIFHIGGQKRTEAELVAAFEPVAMKMNMAVMAGDADETEFARIDAMSIPEWLEGEAGLPATSLIRQLLETAYREEFGLEPEEQSAWNLITLIDYETPDPFHVFGDSDERFHIHEGNDAVALGLAESLEPDQLVLDRALTKVVAVADGFDLTFSSMDGDVTVHAAHVVYALPFTKLREVDLSEAALSSEKMTIIAELGYGTNAKLMLQFSERHWETLGSAGSVITDIGDLQTTWATSRGQDGPQGILTNFVGGNRGIDIGNGTPESQAQMVLPWIDQIWPGTAATYIPGRAIRQHWPTVPYVKGSYASYKVGQWAFFGLEGKAEGNQHFCGEHCSEDYQGYMEGGAETGAMVAAEILDALEVAQPPFLAGLLGQLARRPRASYHGGYGGRMKLREIRKRVAS